MRKLILTISVLLGLTILCLVFPGCGPGGARINMVGSTSVQPIAEILAEKYMKNHKEVSINVQGGGSSAGIKAVQDKSAQIGTSSRELTAAEKSTGLKPVEIALDGIAIINHPQNKVNQLTLEQVRRIFAGEITNWSELGGTNKPIVVVNREEGSGTRAAFTEIVMAEKSITSNALVQGSTGAVRQTVAGNPDAIGYISLASMDNSVKAFAINGIECSIANIKSKQYPVVRPFLFITTAKTPDMVKKFLNYVFAGGQTVISENGLVPVK